MRRRRILPWLIVGTTPLAIVWAGDQGAALLVARKNGLKIGLAVRAIPAHAFQAGAKLPVYFEESAP